MSLRPLVANLDFSNFCALTLAALLASALPVWGQLAPVSPSEGRRATRSEQLAEDTAEITAKRAEIPPQTKIITIRYRCANPAGTGTQTCETGVTRAEFDELVAALNPQMDGTSRQALSGEYAQLLIMAIAARSQKVDQTPEVRTLLNFSRLQILSSQLVKKINSNPPKVSAAEVETYMREHARDYEQVVVRRIMIAARANDASAKSTVDGGTSRAALAQSIHERALKGEDFDQLQREVSGPATSGASTDTRIGPASCLILPVEHNEVCGLQPGAVSNVITDPRGFYIYRMESRQGRPGDEVRKEVREKLERERLQKVLENLRTPVALQLDERYFGKLPEPHLGNMHGLHFPVTAVDPTKPATKAPPMNHEGMGTMDHEHMHDSGPMEHQQ